jgi:glycogen debranching enzyme
MSLELGLARKDRAILPPSELLDMALGGIDLLYNDHYTYAAGYGRFIGVFPRDILEAIKLKYSYPPVARMPNVLIRDENSLDFMVKFQGKKLNPWREEYKGHLPHELRNGFCPSEVMDGLEKAQWPVYIRKDGEREMKYYGAGDVNGLFIEAVGDIARVKASLEGDPEKAVESRNAYIRKMWPNVSAAFWCDVRLAQTGGYDLPDCTPQNLHTLLNHTEADSDYSYIDENGLTPKPPYIFLHNASHFLSAMDKIQGMAAVMGDQKLQEEAAVRSTKGRKALQDLFWMRDEGYYSPLVDGEGNQVKIIRADAIEALWCGVVEQPYANLVIDRLMAPDMLTPWGIRSRSTESTQFRVNGPQAYWNGVVWLHQLGKAAIGFENYGRFIEAGIVDEGLFALASVKKCVENAAITEDGRLLDYRERGVPKACNPQLFAAAAVVARTAPKVLFQSV